MRKRLLITAAARNLGLLMRKLLGVGKPRALQGPLASLINQLDPALQAILRLIRLVMNRSSTGC